VGLGLGLGLGLRLRLSYEAGLTGVLIITSELHLSHELCFIIAGLLVSHSPLYRTRETQRSKDE